MAGRKRKKKEGDPQAGDLRVLLVSLNLILLVFFVYINTIGIEDENKVKKALESLVGTFSVLSGGLNITRGTELSLPAPPAIPKGTEKQNIASKLNSEVIQGKLGKILGEAKINKSIRVSERGRDLVIHMADTMLFPSGSDVLRQQAFPVLSEIATVIHESRLPVRVEGHTDNRPISTEKFPSNWYLSAGRAITVLRYLAENSKIPLDQLTAVGYGEYQPLEPNDTAEHRAINRRVSIVLIGASE